MRQSFQPSFQHAIVALERFRRKPSDQTKHFGCVLHAMYVSSPSRRGIISERNVQKRKKKNWREKNETLLERLRCVIFTVRMKQNTLESPFFSHIRTAFTLLHPLSFVVDLSFTETDYNNQCVRFVEIHVDFTFDNNVKRKTKRISKNDTMSCPAWLHRGWNSDKIRQNREFETTHYTDTPSNR